MGSNPRRTGIPHPGDKGWRREALGRIWVAVVLMLGSIGLVAAAVVVLLHAPGDSAGFGALGSAALIDLPVLPLVILANIRAAHASGAGMPLDQARRLATVGLSLAVLVVFGLAVAAVVIVRTATDLVVVFGGILPVFVALLALWTSRALRS